MNFFDKQVVQGNLQSIPEGFYKIFWGHHMLMRFEGYKSLTLKGHGCQYTVIYTKYMGFIKFKKHILYMYVFRTLLYRLFYRLFTSWTMKLSQGPVNLWLVVEHVPKQLRFTSRKNLKWPWSSRSPKGIFWGLHYPLTWSNGFCGGRGKRNALVEKRQGPMAKKSCHESFQWNIFSGNENEDKKRQKNGQTWIFFTIVLFGHIFNKSTHSLLVHGHTSWSTSGLHLVRGSKTL